MVPWVTPLRILTFLSSTGSQRRRVNVCQAGTSVLCFRAFLVDPVM